MKTLINIKYRLISQWICVAGIMFFLSVSCKDIYDNIKDFSVEEIVYPAKFDTIYGAAGFERVEIDLCKAGRILSSQMRLGKAENTIVEYIANNDSVTLVIDSVCSWLNITGLNEPKLYHFSIYTASKDGRDRSVPLTIDLTPYTSQDRDALGLTPPQIIESTSSVLVEWRSRLSSKTVFNFYSYEYEYKDRDSVVHKGVGEGDLPSFFVENITRGKITTIGMKCRIHPVLDGKLILDTIDWKPTLTVNISDAAIPALFLKSPAGAATVDVIGEPVKFEWVMTDEVNDYTLKLSRNSAFLQGETFEISTGDIGEYDVNVQELSDFFNANLMNLYWTVVPSTTIAGLRTQSRQLQLVNRHPLAVADILDIIFEPDGTAKDVALTTERVQIERIKGTDPLDIIYNETYNRYMVRFDPELGIGKNPSMNQGSFYKINYSENGTFRGSLSNTHSIEVVVMLDEDFPLPSSNTAEVKIFTSMGGGGTGIQLMNRGANNVFSFQPHVNGGWRATTSGITPERGRYYHVVGVWDKVAGKICIYVDGELKGQQDQAGNFAFPSSTANYWFALGGQQGMSGTFPIVTSVMKGNVVAVRVHSKALTAGEVASLYSQL